MTTSLIRLVLPQVADWASKSEPNFDFLTNRGFPQFHKTAEEAAGGQS
jgi:hypothetical protein